MNTSYKILTYLLFLGLFSAMSMTSVDAQCDPPVPSASSNAPICVNHTLFLFGDNMAAGQATGNSYSWTGPNGFTSLQQNPSIPGASLLTSGVYTVTVTNSSGCTASATANATVNPNPVVVIESVIDESCLGAGDGSMTLQVLPLSGFYLITDGFSLLSFDNPAVFEFLYPGTYFIEVIDILGCITVVPVTVGTVPNVGPEITCPSDIIVSNCEGIATWIAPVGTDNCSGAITTQTGGPASGSTFSLGSTTITYTVTDLLLETATCSFNVIVNPNPVPFEASHSDVSCFGLEDGSVTIASNGGTAPFIFTDGVIPGVNQFPVYQPMSC